MKVRIKKASKDTYWYADKIGQEFEVKEFDANAFEVTTDSSCAINKNDCEEVKPTLTPFTFAAWDKDRSQKVFTRDGREVKQLTYFEQGVKYCFAAVVGNEMRAWNKEGIFQENYVNCSLDLFLEHTEKEYWVNVYKSAASPIVQSNSYFSREDAENHGKKSKDYIKTISFKA